MQDPKELATLIRHQWKNSARVPEADPRHNSMQFVYKALNTSDVPGACGVAIEFGVPYTSSRIDFLLTGCSDTPDAAVIIELKRWQEVETVPGQDGIVRTFVGSGGMVVVDDKACSGISCARLDAEGGLQWPCPDAEHPGTPILHTEGLTRGRGEFAAVDHIPAGEQPDEGMPFVMSTGRHLWNSHTNTMNGRAPGLAELNPTGYAEISPEDAEKLGVADGDQIEVTSRRGTVQAPARVTEGIKPGVVFMPFHFADAPANKLTTGEHRDPAAKIPGLKMSAVSVKRVG